MSTNTIVIEQGRIGKDPELKYVGQNNTAMLILSVCTSDSYKKNDEWVNESNWHDIKFFGKAAERVAEEAQKGGEVYVRGHVKTESWDTDQGKRTKQVVMPDLGHVHIYPPRPRGDQQQQSRNPPQQQRRQNTDFEPSDYEGDGSLLDSM